MFRNVTFVVVLVALTSRALGEPEEDLERAGRFKCMVENGLTDGTFTRLPWNHQKMKCYVTCLTKNRGLLNEDGSFNPEKAVEKLDPNLPDYARISLAIYECGTQRSHRECETAYLVVKCLVNRFAYVQPGQEIRHSSRMKCMQENGIEPENFRKTPWYDGKMKCFTACMMRGRGHLKENGTYDVEKAIATLPENLRDRDQMINAIKQCGIIKSDNECETAFLIKTCLRSNTVFPKDKRSYHYNGQNELQ